MQPELEDWQILEGLHYQIDPKPKSKWQYIGKRPKYEIAGKYLFFSHDRRLLIDIAETEIGFYDFDLAKINRRLVKPGADWVLCIYWKDDKRKWELASRYRFISGVHFRFWKSEDKTENGIYSGKYTKEVLHGKRERATRKKAG